MKLRLSQTLGHRGTGRPFFSFALHSVWEVLWLPLHEHRDWRFAHHCSGVPTPDICPPAVRPTAPSLEWAQAESSLLLSPLPGPPHQMGDSLGTHTHTHTAHPGLISLIVSVPGLGSRLRGSDAWMLGLWPPYLLLSLPLSCCSRHGSPPGSLPTPLVGSLEAQKQLQREWEGEFRPPVHCQPPSKAAV